ncbi:uncharacterized protein LOC128735855 [Sabethes cyaneus]|uniref:uncharacterized protein LOC128735855 n=1 Tax=Sabethes cyaneus TaxID=53552 RepID=UPI00237E0168|nr:uncharacterized protein LOC128735855 [Sabethes cyaneus]
MPLTSGVKSEHRTQEMETTRKRKATVLAKTEMLVVIEVWKENVQALRSNAKNSHIYAKMCEELRGLGVDVTPVELKNRIHNLTRKYRTERNAMGPSGGSPSTWEYFDTLHSFLHGFKQNSTRELMDEVIGTDEEFGDAEYLEEALEDGSCSQSSYQSSVGSASSPTPSSSARARYSVAKRKKANFQEKVIELVEKDSSAIKSYLEHAKATDREIVQLMKENNNLMREMIDKM